MAFPARWKAIQKKHLAAVPAGSPFSAYQRAMREASAEYRGETRHVARRNPAQKMGLVTLTAYAGGAYLLYTLAKSQGWLGCPAGQVWDPAQGKCVPAEASAQASG